MATLQIIILFLLIDMNINAVIVVILTITTRPLQHRWYVVDII